MADISPMRIEDVPQCLAVVAEAWGGHVAEIAHPELLQMFATGFSPFYYTCKIGGVVVGLSGYISTWINHGVHSLIYVSVAKAYRRRGIATSLVARCMADVDALDSNLIISTDVPAFYARLGFEVIDQRLFCAGKFSVLMMRRCRSERALLPATEAA